MEWEDVKHSVTHFGTRRQDVLPQLVTNRKPDFWQLVAFTWWYKEYLGVTNLGSSKGLVNFGNVLLKKRKKKKIYWGWYIVTFC